LVVVAIISFGVQIYRLNVQNIKRLLCGFHFLANMKLPELFISNYSYYFKGLGCTLLTVHVWLIFQWAECGERGQDAVYHGGQKCGQDGQDVLCQEWTTGNILEKKAMS